MFLIADGWCYGWSIYIWYTASTWYLDLVRSRFVPLFPSQIGRENFQDFNVYIPVILQEKFYLCNPITVHSSSFHVPGQISTSQDKPYSTNTGFMRQNGIVRQMNDPILVKFMYNFVNLRYFKLWIMLDQIIYVWNILGLDHQVAKIYPLQTDCVEKTQVLYTNKYSFWCRWACGWRYCWRYWCFSW